MNFQDFYEIYKPLSKLHREKKMTDKEFQYVREAMLNAWDCNDELKKMDTDFKKKRYQEEEE